MSDRRYSIAVFPFLKTSGSIPIGNLTFRSTDDVDGLPPEQAQSVTEISQMLFLKDDLRICSSSYAITPHLDLRNQASDVTQLSDIQAAIAYMYVAPHPTFGHVFLSPEHASLIILSPGQVSIYLVRPDFHVEATDSSIELSPDKRGEVSGYSALYNFRHYFWVAQNSRIYGPQPHLTLALAQNLRDDITTVCAHKESFRLLMGLLAKAPTKSSIRIFTAVRWFNSSCRESIDDHEAIVNLAIAFESLLGLPQAEKTERLVDSISLLLGRIPRLEVWARQFYDARSQIVHEGRAQRLHFVASDSAKTVDGPIFRPLLTYGREIFRLCLGTLLIGATMAEESNLEEKFTTNHERFERICKVLANEALSPSERLSQIMMLVETADRYRFIADASIKPETLVGATRLAAKALLDCEKNLAKDKAEALGALVVAKRDANLLSELEALYAISLVMSGEDRSLATEQVETVGKLVNVAWGYLFSHYFSLKNKS